MNNLIHIPIRLIALCAMLCSGAGCLQAADASGELYRRELNEKNPDGKDSVMSFEETKREGDISTIKVVITSGASVPSAMFILRGVYDIARIRKMDYLIKLSEKMEDGGRWTYEFGFANDPKVDVQKHFNRKEPLPEDGGYTFIAVKGLESIFRNQE